MNLSRRALVVAIPYTLYLFGVFRIPVPEALASAGKSNNGSLTFVKEILTFEVAQTLLQGRFRASRSSAFSSSASSLAMVAYPQQLCFLPTWLAQIGASMNFVLDMSAERARQF